MASGATEAKAPGGEAAAPKSGPAAAEPRTKPEAELVTPKEGLAPHHYHRSEDTKTINVEDTDERPSQRADQDAEGDAERPPPSVLAPSSIPSPTSTSAGLGMPL